MNIGARLKTAADLVRQNSKVVDVGTDHAYLPAYLVLSGRVVSAIACDIVQGPLDNAAQTVNEYNLSDKIELRLCNGLQGVDANEVDDIVICGMGGELISSIIDNAKWVRDSAKHLILQPMSAVDDLRIYLAENGFSVEKEVLVKDSSRIYIVISAYYSGKKLDFPPEYAYVGNVSASDYLGKEYLEKEYNRIKKHADMLLNSNKPNAREGLLLIAKAIKERLCSDD